MIHPSASAWASAMRAPENVWRGRIDALYGQGGMPAASRTMLLRALDTFIARFGDTAARVFRAPGRVNLRGMHVDTHGGYLDLMSHQREVMVVFAPQAPGAYTLVNAEHGYADAAFDTDALRAGMLASPTWESFLESPGARAAIEPRGAWWHYVLGAALRAEHGAGGAPLFGFKACVTGNVPPGAALSSSAALCVAATGAIAALNGRALTEAEWILAARDAEWFTGARTGTSDQAASVLCRPGEVCNVALLAEDFSLESLRRVPFPSELRLVVINSHTRRSLSGAEQIAYSTNRFAYSMALDAFRQEWRALTGDAAAAEKLDRLSRIFTGDAAALARVYDVLARVPERATLVALHERYRFAGLDAQYARYFGGAPEALRPTEFNLRGPLLYGIAESERARRFADWLACGDYAAAGRAMSAGHNGDRVRTVDGAPFVREAPASALAAARVAGTPITEFPGDFGASSPALDALVDAAVGAGALGASLTGAGIAGCVIALCRAEDTAQICAAARARMASADYPSLANRAAPLGEDELAEAAVVNAPSMGACELPWPA